MQKLYLTLFLVFASLMANATQVAFSGLIKNSSAQEIRISLLINNLTQERSVFVCKLNETEKGNTFNISVDVPSNQIAELLYEDKKTEVFVDLTMPKIELEVDYNDWERSLFFKGKSGPNNQFFKSYRNYYVKAYKETENYTLGFLSTTFDKEEANRAKSYAIHDYFKILRERYDEQQRFLNGEPRISRALRDFARNEINWRFETKKLGYFLVNKDFIDLSQLPKQWLRYQLMQTVDISDEKSLQYTSYQNLLSAFIHYLHLETLAGKQQDLDLDFYRFIERNLSGRPRFFMQGKLMLNAYQDGYPDLAQRKFKGFIRFNPYQGYTQTLEYIFGNNLEQVKKVNVTDFTFLDTNSLEKRLSDYRGKVVFVSFWASWCAPCIKGFRESHFTRQELERMGVVFLNVSIDQEENTWRKILPRVQVPGQHAYAMDISAFQKQMGFTTIPFYALVDKYGRLNYMSTDDINSSKEDFMALLRE